MNNVQKESIDDVQELKIKMEDTVQHITGLKDDYEVRNIKQMHCSGMHNLLSLIVQKKLSAKEVEINQLNDEVTELNLKQTELKTENKILKRKIEQWRDSAKVSTISELLIDFSLQLHMYVQYGIC